VRADSLAEQSAYNMGYQAGHNDAIANDAAYDRGFQAGYAKACADMQAWAHNQYEGKGPNGQAE